MKVIKKNFMFIFIFTLGVLVPLIYQIINYKTMNITEVIVSTTLGTLYAVGWKYFLEKNVMGLYLYIIGLIINIIVGYTKQAYGDMLLRLLYMLPMQFLILRNWNEQLKNTNVIRYHKLRLNELIINVIIAIMLILILSFLIQNISNIPIISKVFKQDDPYIYLDATAVVANVLGQYHLSKQHLGWFGLNAVADGSLFLMWILIWINKHDANSLVLALSNLSYVLSAVYQYFAESKLEDSITHETFDVVFEEDTK